MELKARWADGRLLRTFVAVGACGVSLTLGGASLGGGRVAVSIAVGATVGLGNLYVLSRLVAAFADPERPVATNAGLAWGVIALAKLLALFGGLWFVMTHHLLDPVQLVIGYAALPIGIAIGAVVGDRSER